MAWSAVENHDRQSDFQLIVCPKYTLFSSNFMRNILVVSEIVQASIDVDKVKKIERKTRTVQKAFR